MDARRIITVGFLGALLLAGTADARGAGDGAAGKPAQTGPAGLRSVELSRARGRGNGRHGPDAHRRLEPRARARRCRSSPCSSTGARPRLRPCRPGSLSPSRTFRTSGPGPSSTSSSATTPSPRSPSRTSFRSARAPIASTSRPACPTRSPTRSTAPSSSGRGSRPSASSSPTTPGTWDSRPSTGRRRGRSSRPSPGGSRPTRPSAPAGPRPSRPAARSNTPSISRPTAAAGAAASRSCSASATSTTSKSSTTALFRRADLAWVRRAYLMVLQFAWDRTYYDREAGYTFDRTLTAWDRTLGPVDIFTIWPTWPRLGLDSRNQWDMYRDLPGGLDELRRQVDLAHSLGKKYFISYNPWDESTRHEDHIAGMEADAPDARRRRRRPRHPGRVEPRVPGGGRPGQARHHHVQRGHGRAAGHARHRLRPRPRRPLHAAAAQPEQVHEARLRHLPGAAAGRGAVPPRGGRGLLQRLRLGDQHHAPGPARLDRGGSPLPRPDDQAPAREFLGLPRPGIGSRSSRRSRTGCGPTAGATARRPSSRSTA